MWKEQVNYNQSAFVETARKSNHEKSTSQKMVKINALDMLTVLTSVFIKHIFNNVELF